MTLSASSLTCSGYRHLHSSLQEKYLTWYTSHCISATAIVTPLPTIAFIPATKEPVTIINDEKDFTTVATPTPSMTPTPTRQYRKVMPKTMYNQITKFVGEHVVELVVGGVMGFITLGAACINHINQHVETATTTSTPAVTPTITPSAAPPVLPLVADQGGGGGSAVSLSDLMGAKMVVSAIAEEHFPANTTGLNMIVGGGAVAYGRGAVAYAPQIAPAIAVTEYTALAEGIMGVSQGEVDSEDEPPAESQRLVVQIAHPEGDEDGNPLETSMHSATGEGSPAIVGDAVVEGGDHA